MELYITKNIEPFEAEKVGEDVILERKGEPIYYIRQGYYIIKMPGGELYPIPNKLFEMFFERKQDE